jgi:hypothetical protein
MKESIGVKTLAVLKQSLSEILVSNAYPTVLSAKTGFRKLTTSNPAKTTSQSSN